eukprot:GHVS01029592.1.p1 GENE.GHVS01029592.1~~GHVS01029592.1.p1  ORF type:complete len:229 (+),score=29.88 GHVS01029592.1:386-1072(+)
MPAGGQAKSGLFQGAPISCGLFGNLGASTSSSATAGGGAEVGEDNVAEEEASALETTISEDEESALQDSTCRLSKLVKKETSDGHSSSEWIPSIMGKIEVNRPKPPAEGRSRIIFRQNASGRLLLNTDILPEVAYTIFKAKSLIFNGRQIEDQTQLIPYRLTFSSGEARTKFLSCVEELQKSNGASSTTKSATVESSASTEAASAPVEAGKETAVAANSDEEAGAATK